MCLFGCSRPSKPDMNGCKGGVEPCPCKPISTVRIVALEFESDHKLLKNYKADWSDGGARYPKPEWTPANQYPLSHNMDTTVAIKVTIDVLPADACPATGTLKGEGPGGLIFEKAGYSFTPGQHTIAMTSDRKLKKEVQVLDFAIQWKAEGIGATVTPASTANKMYVTYDTPYNDTAYNNNVTEKRMEWVCALCNGDSNGHDSVKKIHDSTASYDLTAPIPSEHWGVAGGTPCQCMDLAKFYMLATEMLGLRSGKVVYLYPKPGKTTKESTSGSDVERRGVASSTPAHASGSTHGAHNPNEEVLLVDHSGGWNNFEACFKFTHQNRPSKPNTRYYAGGASDYDTAQDVMKAVCKVTHWTFAGGGGGWSICATPGPSPIDTW